MTPKFADAKTGMALAMVALLACAVPQSNAAPSSTLRAGYDVVYRPAIGGGSSFDSAKRDIEVSLEHLRLYPDICPPLVLQVNNTKVYDDRIEISWTNDCGEPQKYGVLVLHHYKIQNAEIVVEYRKEGYGGIRHEINFPGLVNLQFSRLSSAQKAADALLIIQTEERKGDLERANELARFEEVAAEYRAMNPKPPMSEEQRKFIVQANAQNSQKAYAKAIEGYRKAVAVDPVSYPPAYFNMALLSAQMQQFKQAIGYMKRYLLLVPDANDARAAKDKIYEWEINLSED